MVNDISLSNEEVGELARSVTTLIRCFTHMGTPASLHSGQPARWVQQT